MMPMMKLRRRKQEAQQAKSEADIGVNQNRLPLIKQGVEPLAWLLGEPA
jgi:hypothetical protein